MRDECATRPAESLAEGRQRAEPPRACCSYPNDDPARAHLGDRHWTNRSSHRWRRRCPPLLRARLQPEPDGDDGAVGSARDDDSRGDDAGGASSLHRPKPWGGDRGAGRNGDRSRTPRSGPPVSPGSSPARPPGRERIALAGECVWPRLAGVTTLQSRVSGDFSSGFEQLIDIPYFAEPPLTGCDRRGPFTAFVIVGPYSAQRKLSGSEVGCYEASLTITLLMSSRPCVAGLDKRALLKRSRSPTRPERHLPQPRVSLRFALPQTRDGVQQGARFSRIARHALTEDLVATKRTRKLDAMPRPEEIQPAPVSLLDGGVDHVEGDEPEPSWHLPDTDVIELVAAAHGSSDPDNRAVLRDAIPAPKAFGEVERDTPHVRGENPVHPRPCPPPPPTNGRRACRRTQAPRRMR